MNVHNLRGNGKPNAVGFGLSVAGGSKREADGKKTSGMHGKLFRDDVGCVWADYCAPLEGLILGDEDEGWNIF